MLKRLAFQNKRLAISQMAFRARKVFGTFEKQAQAPVIQTMDSAIHRINRYPLDNSTGFASVIFIFHGPPLLTFKTDRLDLKELDPGKNDVKGLQA